jgi:hypothetical protein
MDVSQKRYRYFLKKKNKIIIIYISVFIFNLIITFFINYLNVIEYSVSAGYDKSERLMKCYHVL